MKFSIFIILLGCIAGSLSACNTMRGAGADVMSTGAAIGRAATPSPICY